MSQAAVPKANPCLAWTVGEYREGQALQHCKMDTPLPAEGALIASKSEAVYRFISAEKRNLASDAE